MWSKILLALILLPIYVYVFMHVYAACKISRTEVVFGLSADSSGYLNPDQVLNDFATPEKISQEPDPSNKRFLLNLRTAAEDAISKAYGEGLLFGILSLNLFWIPVLLRRKRQSAIGR